MVCLIPGPKIRLWGTQIHSWGHGPSAGKDGIP
jgi:hypothetical protein